LFKADSSRKRRGFSRIGRGSVGRVPAIMYADTDRYGLVADDDYVHTLCVIDCVWITECISAAVYISATVYV
jgi:hypothetical protein